MHHHSWLEKIYFLIICLCLQVLSEVKPEERVGCPGVGVMVVKSLMWELQTELGSSEKAVLTSNLNLRVELHQAF